MLSGSKCTIIDVFKMDSMQKPFLHDLSLIVYLTHVNMYDSLFTPSRYSLLEAFQVLSLRQIKLLSLVLSHFFELSYYASSRYIFIKEKFREQVMKYIIQNSKYEEKCHLIVT